jgi:hypothetical protein
LPWTFEEAAQIRLADIPDSMGRVDEVVAGEKISIVFDDRNVAAGRTEEAEGMLLAEGDADRFFDDLNFDPADVVPDPFIENRTEERPPRFSPDGEGTEAVGLLRMWLDQGEETDFAGSDRFEKSIDLVR